MHYQTMQGEFLSSPLNIRDANHSANKKSYVLGHLAASLFLLWAITLPIPFPHMVHIYFQPSKINCGFRQQDFLDQIRRPNRK